MKFIKLISLFSLVLLFSGCVLLQPKDESGVTNSELISAMDTLIKDNESMKRKQLSLEKENKTLMSQVGEVRGTLGYMDTKVKRLEKTASCDVVKKDKYKPKTVIFRVNANIREAADIESPVIAKAIKGSPVVAVDEKNGFYKLKSGGWTYRTMVIELVVPGLKNDG